jgi:hypothetical protein
VYDDLEPRQAAGNLPEEPSLALCTPWQPPVWHTDGGEDGVEIVRQLVVALDDVPPTFLDEEDSSSVGVARLPHRPRVAKRFRSRNPLFGTCP